MRARISRLTILSEGNYALGRFYEGFFHMRPTGRRGATEAVSLTDGHIVLDIEPRVPGYPAQLDHFGLEVDDLESALARLRRGYPGIAWLERRGGRTAVPVFAHDPAGNVFGLSQAAPKDPGDGRAADGGKRGRVINHVALRVLHPERVAEFYAEIFGLSPVDGPSEGANFYLSDGHVTLSIIPWRIGDFQGTGISARGMDHIGFRVESIDALTREIDRVVEKNYRFRPGTSVVGRGKEGANRLAMFRRTCPLGRHQLADPDGLIIDVTE